MSHASSPSCRMSHSSSCKVPMIRKGQLSLAGPFGCVGERERLKGPRHQFIQDETSGSNVALRSPAGHSGRRGGTGSLDASQEPILPCLDAPQQAPSSAWYAEPNPWRARSQPSHICANEPAACSQPASACNKSRSQQSLPPEVLWLMHGQGRSESFLGGRSGTPVRWTR